MSFTTEMLVYISIAILAHVAVFYLVVTTRKRKRSLRGKHVMVTGGSKGIGLWNAILCAQEGAHVTIIARDVVHLEKAIQLIEAHRQNESQRFAYKSIDLIGSFEEVSASLEEVEKDGGPIYMVVNCAGTAICGLFDEMSPADANFLMDANYKTAYNCIRFVLPKMKQARSGIILITGSVLSLVGIYGYGPYAAAKFALRGIAEAISMECSHLGISVTLAMPPDTDTPGFHIEEKTKPLETKMISGMGGLYQPEEVARQMIKDALEGNFFSVIGSSNWMIAIVCSGLAPWGGFFFTWLQALIIMPLKLVAYFIHWYIYFILQKCDKEKRKQETAS